MTEQENRRFNAWLANLRTELRTVGELEDGTPLTVEVPSLGLGK